MMSSSAASLIVFSTLVIFPALAYGANNCGLFNCATGSWCCKTTAIILSVDHCSDYNIIGSDCVYFLFQNWIGLSRTVIIVIAIAVGVVLIGSCVACCCCCCCRSGGQTNPPPAAPVVFANQPGAYYPQHYPQQQPTHPPAYGYSSNKQSEEAPYPLQNYDKGKDFE